MFATIPPWKLFSFSLLLGAALLTGCSDVVSPHEPAAEHLALEAAPLAHALSADTAYIIVFHEATADVEATSKKVIDRYGLKRRHTYRFNFKGVAGTLPPGQLKHLLSDPDVARIEHDRSFRLVPITGTGKPANRQSVPWGIEHVGATLSSTAAGDGQGSVAVDLFVLDSGVSHSDLLVVEALDFTNAQRPDPTDYYGHGTHVAGTAAALDDKHDVVGVAPGARVHNLKVLNNNGSGQFSDVIAALEHVMQQKLASPATPMVVNLSLGAETGTSAYNLLDEAVQRAVAQGIVVCVAAGNSAIDAAHVSPAHVAEAITVGAYGQQSEFASFSNYGSVVDLLAPGVNVLSTWSKKRGVESLSGTSMAVAHVSGAAALYLSANPGATPAQVAEALRARARASVGGAPAGTVNLGLYVAGF